MYCWDLSGWKTLCFQRRGCRFNPWSVNWKSHMPCSGVRKEKKKNCGVTNTTQKAIKACPRTTIYILGVNIPRWKNTVSVANWPPYKKEADDLVGGSFNEQRNLHTKVVLSNCKIRPPHPPPRIEQNKTDNLPFWGLVAFSYLLPHSLFEARGVRFSSPKPIFLASSLSFPQINFLQNLLPPKF